jgi:pentatricopeptide repeat protein
MVEALVVNGETDAAFKVITDSKRTAESRSAINAVAYGSVMKGHSLARNIKAVWAVYQDMLAEGTELSAVTYNILVNACCRCEEMDRIPAILEKMAQENLKPDIVTFSAIIKGYCLIGQIDHAFELLKSIDRDGHTPDEFTYNTLIDGCARQGQYERGMRVLKTMQDAGVPPSNFTLSVLVKLVSRGKRLQEAFELCETLSQTHRFGLNVHVYNNLVQACIHNGDVQRGISVLAKMARESTLPDQRTYRLLLNATAKRAAETKAIIALLRAAAGLPPGLDALEHVDATKLRPTGGLPPELVSESLEAVAMVTSDGGGALAMNLLADLRSIPSMRVDSKVAARITSLALRDGTQSGALKTKP